MDPQEPFILRPEATALLVNDMQNDFLLPDAPVPAPGGPELVPVMADLDRHGGVGRQSRRSGPGNCGGG